MTKKSVYLLTLDKGAVRLKPYPKINIQKGEKKICKEIKKLI
jgi:hypothetical protein